MKRLSLVVWVLLGVSGCAEIPYNFEDKAAVVQISGEVVHVTGLVVESTPHLVVNDRIVVLVSGGGLIDSTFAVAQKSKQVRATRMCESACIWLLEFTDNTCLDESVEELRFHSIGRTYKNWLGVKRREIDEIETLVFVAHLREPLRTKLESLYTTNEPIPVSAAEFLTAYPEKSCFSHWLRDPARVVEPEMVYEF